MGRQKKVQEKADLHIHTIASFDGSLTRKKIHMDCRRHNITNAALCDHNTTAEIEALVLENGGNLSDAYTTVDGINYIHAGELTAGLAGFFDERGYPYTMHLKFLGADISHTSPLYRMVKAKEENETLVIYSILEYLSKKIGVALDPDYVKEYILERRRVDDRFSKFDEVSAVDYFEIFNLSPGRSERELTKILRNIPRPKKIYFDVRDVIEVVHASGGLVTMAHPSQTLAKIPPELHKSIIERLLELNIDGFERVYNSAKPETNELIDQCQKEHYSVNLYVDDAGSDNHHVSHGCPIGRTYTGEITCDKVAILLEEIKKRQYEIEHGMGWHRSYPIKTKEQIEHIVEHYETLNQKFKTEFGVKLSEFDLKK